MSRLVLFLVAALLAFPPGVQPQEVVATAVEIPIESSVLQGQFFAAQTGRPLPTLLLVPGWPGGTRDVLGLGRALVGHEINVLIFNPRGMHQSSGITSFAGALEDIAAAFDWLHSVDVIRRFNVDTTSLTVAGHSFGGGMALIYAARNARVRRLISIAGTDHSVLITEFERNPQFASTFREALRSTQHPAGPVRFDLETILTELSRDRQVYGFRENAARLQDRSILLLGGWDDVNTPIEAHLLPLYRALKASGADNVEFIVYRDDHSFERVRADLATKIREWMVR